MSGIDRVDGRERVRKYMNFKYDMNLNRNGVGNVLTYLKGPPLQGIFRQIMDKPITADILWFIRLNQTSVVILNSFGFSLNCIKGDRMS